METLPETKLLQFNENTLYQVRELFVLHEADAMKQAVEILEQWLQKQYHFTQRQFDKEYLERTIILSKGSLEKAKARLDKVCTMRTLMPHLFGIYDLRELYKTDLIDIKQILLPKMTKNHERVYIMKNVGQTFENTMLISYTRAITSIGMYLRRHDYAASYYVVIDYENVNLTELTKRLNIAEMQEIITVILDGCGFRVSGLYVISKSKLIEMVVTVFKQLMSSKIGGRVNVLKSFEELHEVLDKDILPKEYGGKEKSVDELNEEWIDVLMSDEHVEYMRYMNSARTDESLRPKDKFNEQCLGLPGTFRTLTVD